MYSVLTAAKVRRVSPELSEDSIKEVRSEGVEAIPRGECQLSEVELSVRVVEVDPNVIEGSCEFLTDAYDFI